MKDDCHFPLVPAAAYLGKSPRWLQSRLDGPNPPPSFKIGKSRLFRKSELDEWLEQFRAGADLDTTEAAVGAELESGHRK
jgi:hypothetical protein